MDDDVVVVELRWCVGLSWGLFGGNWNKAEPDWK